MKNRGEVIASIHNAQALYKEAPTKFTSQMTRPLLEALLHTYVARYRATAAPAKAFATVDCHACGLTGIYADNGGPCFRCKGKGFQDEADQKRNYGYDLHHRPTTAAAVAEVISAEIIQLPLLNEDDIVF